MVEIISNLVPMCVLLGTDFTITGGVEGLEDNHVVRWLQNEVEIEEDRCSDRITHITGENGEFMLDIRNAETGDAGTYSIRVYLRRDDRSLCQVDERMVVEVEVGDCCKDDEFRLEHVAYKPDESKLSFSQKMWRVCVLPGKRITLEITAVEGVAENYIISWHKNDAPITIGDKKLMDDHCNDRITPRIGKNGDILLDIKNAEITDEGVYSIVVYEEIHDNILRQITNNEFVARVEVGECKDDDMQMRFSVQYQKMVMREFRKQLDKNHVYNA